MLALKLEFAPSAIPISEHGLFQSSHELDSFTAEKLSLL
jgi:hypothetical protein